MRGFCQIDQRHKRESSRPDRRVVMHSRQSALHRSVGTAYYFLPRDESLLHDCSLVARAQRVLSQSLRFERELVCSPEFL